MSYLATDQLKNQTINIPLRLLKSATIAAIRLKVFKNGVLTDGSFSLSLESDGQVLGEVAITGQEISEAVTGTYAIGYLRWQFANPIRVNKKSDVGYVDVNLKLVVSGLTESDSIYLALVRQHEFKFITEFGAEAPPAAPDYEAAWYSAYGMEVYTI